MNIDWPARFKACLDAPDGAHPHQQFSDFDLNARDFTPAATVRQAAVLVPLVERRAGWQVLLTRRTDDLPTHAGQISFPGGGVKSGETHSRAALREFEEETGIAQNKVHLLGRFERYETGSGFHISPFVGVVKTPFTVRPDPREVAEVFEVPLDFLMDEANHRRESLVWRGKKRHFYAMPWQEYYIWGATAGMVRALALRITKKEQTHAAPQSD